MGYFFIAIIAFALGFVIGIKSKAQAKIKRREKVVEESITGTLDKILVEAKQDNMPGHRTAPPPPTPPPARVIKEGQIPTPPAKIVNYIKPGFGYRKGIFAKVNKCRSCGAIGYNYDMHTVNPCPFCGGTVQSHGAAKWDDEQWIMSKE